MIKIPNNPTVFFDVDNTLIMWPDKISLVSGDCLGAPIFFESDIMGYPHAKHIDQMRQFKARGHTVVVWSAGKADWAEIAVKALKIEHLVDYVMGKPDWVIDDLQPEEFIPPSARYYISK